MVFVGWILPAADPRARIQTQGAYLEGDSRKHGQGSGEARQAREMQPTQCKLSNGLCSGQLKFHPTGSPGRPAWNIPQNYPNWGRERWGIYPQGPTCQCWRTALFRAVRSLAHLPAPQGLRGSRPVGWESPQPWLQLEAVSWHPGHTWAPAPAITLRL